MSEISQDRRWMRRHKPKLPPEARVARTKRKFRASLYDRCPRCGEDKLRTSTICGQCWKEVGGKYSQSLQRGKRFSKIVLRPVLKEYRPRSAAAKADWNARLARLKQWQEEHQW